MKMFSTFKRSLVSLRFPILVAVSIWLKTYIITKIAFDLTTGSFIQEVILFISPLAVSMFLVGLSLFFTGPKRNYIILSINIFLSIILVGNVLFHGFYNDFITLPILFQTSNASSLSSSVKALLQPYMLLIIADIIVIWVLAKKRPSFVSIEKIAAPVKGIFFLLTAVVFIVNLSLAEADRPQLLTRSFDREYLVKYLGLYFYQGYDAALQLKTTSQKAFADSDELTEVENYVQSNKVQSDSDLTGSMKGKNVIVISLESFQSLLIGAKVNGEEVTPFLNSFIEESYYFDNFYHQTAQGKTSDAEFITDTSMYPLDRGSVFFTHATNEFTATPEIVKDAGYSTAVFHANNASFWNRNVMYSSLGYDTFFAINSYDVTDENTIGWGLNDVSFFEQSMANLESLPQPFYAKFITLTNHYPYEIDEKDATIDAFDSGDSSFDSWFQTARYLDEALESFVNDLKESGLYDDTVIVMYGDHYGQSENHNKAMAKFLGLDEISTANQVELQKTPLIIHLAGQTDGETISDVAGQIDVKPTILSLLGIETDNIVQFGHDLFASEREQLVIFRDGSFITGKYIYTGGVFYSKDTGEEVEVPKDEAENLINKAAQELALSDKVIYGDLLNYSEANLIDSSEMKTEIK